MSYVNTETCSNEAIQKLRGLLIDEIGATRAYDEISKMYPEYSNILQEIKNDEINHQGRLIDLIMTIDPSQKESFNKGLAQEE